jgi:hypothetical protein
LGIRTARLFPHFWTRVLTCVSTLSIPSSGTRLRRRRLSIRIVSTPEVVRGKRPRLSCPMWQVET